MIIQTCGKSYNQDLDIHNLQILTPASAFGILKKTLVSNIGKNRLKGFLIRFGWEMGVNDAKKFSKKSYHLKIYLNKDPSSIA